MASGPEVNIKAGANSSTIEESESKTNCNLDLRTRLLLQCLAEKLSTLEIARLMSQNRLNPIVDKNEFKVALAAAREHRRQRSMAAAREQAHANRQHERFLGNQIVKVK